MNATWHRIQIAIAMLSSLLLWPGDAPAPGGAGMCGVPTCNKMVTPAILGTPEQLKTAVESEIDEEVKQLPISTRTKFYFFSNDRETWRQSRRNELLSESLRYAGHTALLDYAVASGNMAVVKFLLDSGVNPNAIVSGQGDTLFHRCVFVPTVWKDGKMLEDKDFPIAKRFEAMELVLKRGGDLQIRNRHGNSAVHSCYNQAIVEFYFRKIAELVN